MGEDCSCSKSTVTCPVDIPPSRITPTAKRNKICYLPDCLYITLRSLTLANLHIGSNKPSLARSICVTWFPWQRGQCSRPVTSRFCCARSIPASCRHDGRRRMSTSRSWRQSPALHRLHFRQRIRSQWRTRSRLSTVAWGRHAFDNKFIHGHLCMFSSDSGIFSQSLWLL